MTPDLWESGTAAPVEDIATELLPFLSETDGLTISGGEPFEQPDALCALLDILRKEMEVETLIYSGYSREELLTASPAIRALLSRVDMLIDGPFIASMPNQLQWRGSDNQRVHLLSPRSQRYAAEIDRFMPDPRPLQVQMLPSGSCRIIGIPRRGDLDAYRSVMATRGIEVK